MKKIGVILLALLLIVPPLQAHTDAVVFVAESEAHHDVLNELHQEEHHQNDTEEEKNKEHHHHCNVITVTAEFIPVEYHFDIVPFFEIRKAIDFYQNTYNFSYLKGIFQPPKF
ncbi:conserved exported hypothetical protein [Tenacibaculum sediminilitoris]|uniref:hypothetical protein n=1 Tax=Tenacibaculum sediminilitoris TaxID=1820334 RepID=UPI003894FB33